jgi:predicted NBD/HSP70 family sugar kinase
MGAIGIDIGGTKIELQVFDRAWGRIARDRRPTPADYAGLLEAVAELVGSAQAAHGPLPVGISAAGLVDRRSGLAITANLPATGRPFPADLAARLGQRVAFINDCQAMALSEARLGAGRGHRRVAGLILGTGVGMGVLGASALQNGVSVLSGIGIALRAENNTGAEQTHALCLTDVVTEPKSLGVELLY